MAIHRRRLRDALVDWPRPRAKNHYRRRKVVPEPVFGWGKQAMGFRRFSVRGRECCSSDDPYCLRPVIDIIFSNGLASGNAEITCRKSRFCMNNSREEISGPCPSSQCRPAVSTMSPEVEE
ncbi:transposase [Sinimarinibacterium flocculans]|uniref:transposase n=1 Tax=Sinimarinibacterium flocculans TaxID=985250 RepID=UPI003F509EC7